MSTFLSPDLTSELQSQISHSLWAISISMSYHHLNLNILRIRLLPLFSRPVPSLDGSISVIFLFFPGHSYTNQSLNFQCFTFDTTHIHPLFCSHTHHPPLFALLSCCTIAITAYSSSPLFSPASNLLHILKSYVFSQDTVVTIPSFG